MSVFVSAEALNERIKTGQKHTIIAALWERTDGKAWSKLSLIHI